MLYKILTILILTVLTYVSWKLNIYSPNVFLAADLGDRTQGDFCQDITAELTEHKVKPFPRIIVCGELVGSDAVAGASVKLSVGDYELATLTSVSATETWDDTLKSNIMGFIPANQELIIEALETFSGAGGATLMLQILPAKRSVSY